MHRLSFFGLGAVLLGLLLSQAASAATSGITGITITGTKDVGTFNGVPYSRTWGTIAGRVAATEKVEGLTGLPKDASGAYVYTSPFEIIAPSRQGANSTILVEAENRGHPLMLDYLDRIDAAGDRAKAPLPSGLGNGFLENRGFSYGRVSWQVGISPGVPASAQGIGEVIVRDFGRLLAGDRSTLSAGAPSLGQYRTLLLGGISQSAWFVNTFIAEGFDAEPVSGKRVFQGALAIDGTGNWLALNQLAAAHHAAQAPYFAPNAAPLSPRQLLNRPESDPFYVDVANYTDFYRIHASLTDTVDLPTGMRRYDWPSAHHPVLTAADAASTFSAKRPGGACNDGVAVSLNPTSYLPFLRTLVAELAQQVGSPHTAESPALPPSSLFELGPAPTSTDHFNPLTGVELKVPITGPDSEPRGGVRFPDEVVPLGRPVPVSLPPVITSTIAGICGNVGQWQPFTKAETVKRYGSEATFLEDYAKAIDRVVSTSYLLSSEKPGMLSEAAARYTAATDH